MRHEELEFTTPKYHSSFNFLHYLSLFKLCIKSHVLFSPPLRRRGSRGPRDGLVMGRFEFGKSRLRLAYYILLLLYIYIYYSLSLAICGSQYRAASELGVSKMGLSLLPYVLVLFLCVWNPVYMNDSVGPGAVGPKSTSASHITLVCGHYRARNGETGPLNKLKLREGW